MPRIVAVSTDRYRASAAERRQYGGATVTDFLVYREEDRHHSERWVKIRGFGKTPGERKTDAIRRSGLAAPAAPPGGEGRDARRFRRPTPAEQEQISAKIRVLRHEGYPPKQAIAIAYRMAGVPERGARRRKRT